MTPHSPRTLDELDAALSDPSVQAIDALAALEGDVIVLGAGGKMGPTLARMARRALDATGGARRRVLAVSRWSDARAAESLRGHGVEVLSADLLDRRAVDALPFAPNVVFMAGQKFGSAHDAVQTWAMNAVVPAWCAERYAGARQVVFSTGNVYPFVPTASGGARESTPPAPIGDYAMSCLARERVAAALGARHASPVVLLRLNYACALTYGVLTDLAVRLRDGEPIDLTMGHVNVCWQGDANAIALALLVRAAVPAVPVNVTGDGVLSVETLARALAARLDVAPAFTGAPAPDALLSDASALPAHLGTAPPAMPLETLLDWTAEWVRAGRPLLGKPTKFAVRDGRF
jgi:nucleoside-diphosphate-sugar epimerase